jgi:hypothetical protein
MVYAVQLETLRSVSRNWEELLLQGVSGHTSVVSTMKAHYPFGPMRKLSPSILDYGLFLPSIGLTSALGISLRLIGPLFIVVPVGFCLLYAILRRTMPPRLLSAYFGFCIFAGVLSKYKLFPTSWQTQFIAEAIVRQLVPLLGFFAVTWASKAYFRQKFQNSEDVFSGGPGFIVLSFFIAPAIMYQQGVGYQGDHSIFSVIGLCSSMINNALIGYFFILGYIFFTRDWRRYVGLITILGFALTTHFIQFRILAAFILAMLFGLPSRKLAVGLVASMVCIYAIGMNFSSEMMIKFPNEGLRLVMSADAISSAVDAHGLGIGYGTESVRFRYRIPDMPDFTFLPDPKSMTRERMLEALSNGVENSFIQALMRVGVLGFVLLLAAFSAAFPPGNLPRDVRHHAACVFIMSFLGCFVNSALESPLAVVGHGFSIGYLLALRASAQLSPHRMRPVSRHARAARMEDSSSPYFSLTNVRKPPARERIREKLFQ